MVKIKNNAISNVIATLILLGISISLFSVVQGTVIFYPFDSPNTSINLISYIDNDEIIIEHHGGESISLQSKILVTIDDGDKNEIIACDYIDTILSDGDDSWDIGEKIVYNPGFTDFLCRKPAFSYKYHYPRLR